MNNAFGDQLLQSGLMDNEFTERQKFLGRFKIKGQISPSFTVHLTYSMLGDRPIEGVLLSNDDIAAELYNFYMVFGPYVDFESVSTDPDALEITSENLQWGYRRTHRPADERTQIIDQVGAVLFYELRIRRRLANSKEPVRHATFYLKGPTTLWPSYSSRVFKYDGNVESKLYNERFSLEGLSTFSLTACRHYFYDLHRPDIFSPRHENENLIEVNRERNVYSIELHDRFPEFPIEEKKIRGIVDNICLLMSFLSKGTITWYGYTLTFNSKTEMFLKDTGDVSEFNVDRNDVVVDLPKIYEFLSVAHPALASLRSLNVDLRVPILLYSSAQRLNDIDEKFIAVFRSLEIILDSYAINEDLSKITSNCQLKKIRKAIKDHLENTKLTSDQKDWIIAKIPELNRPPISTKMLLLLKQFDIEISDIGDKPGISGMIALRNKILHSSEFVDMADMVKEYARLTTVLERIILTLLGWHDLGRTPTYFNKHTLSE